MKIWEKYFRLEDVIIPSEILEEVRELFPDSLNLHEAMQSHKPGIALKLLDEKIAAQQRKLPWLEVLRLIDAGELTALREGAAQTVRMEQFRVEFLRSVYK